MDIRNKLTIIWQGKCFVKFDYYWNKTNRPNSWPELIKTMLCSAIWPDAGAHDLAWQMILYLVKYTNMKLLSDLGWGLSETSHGSVWAERENGHTQSAESPGMATWADGEAVCEKEDKRLIDRFRSLRILDHDRPWTRGLWLMLQMWCN